MILENKSKLNFSSLNITKPNKIKNTKIHNNIKPISIHNYKKKNYNMQNINNNTYNKKAVNKSVEIINKKRNINNNSRDKVYNSINLTFKSLKEREIITKNICGAFIKDSAIRLKNQKTKDAMKIKIEKYRKIFNMIDRNHTGIISIKNLNLSVIDNDELIFLTPVLIELQKNRKSMDFKEFCIKIDRCLTSKVLIDD